MFCIILIFIIIYYIFNVSCLILIFRPPMQLITIVINSLGCFHFLFFFILNVVMNKQLGFSLFSLLCLCHSGSDYLSRTDDKSSWSRPDSSASGQYTYTIPSPTEMHIVTRPGQTHHTYCQLYMYADISQRYFQSSSSACVLVCRASHAEE